MRSRILIEVWRHGWEVALAAILLAELVIFSVVVPDFFTSVSDTIRTTEQVVPIGLVAIGLSITLLSGGIDLSIGSVASASAAVMGILWASAGLNIWLAVVIALIASAGLGAANGVVVSYMRITPFVATLGTLFLYDSVATAILDSRGKPVYGFPQSFGFLGTGKVIGFLPLQLLVAAVICVAAAVLSTHTIFGRQLRMIGYSPAAARFSGVEIRRMQISVYTLSGLLSGVAGVVLAAYFGTTRAGIGAPVLLPAVTAAVLGGVSISGGSGSIVGVGLATLVVGYLQQGLLVNGIEPLTIQLVVAGLLVALMGFRINKDRVRLRGGLKLLRSK